MGKNTAIEWAKHTFNAWQGCTKVSPGCAHCYAEALVNRFHPENEFWGRRAGRIFHSDQYWRQPLAWDREAAQAGVRDRVFAGSLCDVFENDFALKRVAEQVSEERRRLFALIKRTPNLIWLLLTKRPENVLALVPAHWIADHGRLWPTNAWIGTSVENQDMADKRIPELLQIPAPMRFLSCEPLLGPVDLRNAMWPQNAPAWMGRDGAPGIGWVIVGGESGPDARPMEKPWAQSLQAQCAVEFVPFFFKQWGAWSGYGEGSPGPLDLTGKDVIFDGSGHQR